MFTGVLQVVRMFWLSRYANVDMEGALECFGRVDTQKCRYGGCTRMFWSSRYAEM